MLSIFKALSEKSLKTIEEFHKKTDGHIQHCVKEIGVTPEVARKLAFGDFSLNDEKSQVRNLVPNPKRHRQSRIIYLSSPQCFVNCFFRRLGFFDEDNNVNKELIITKLSEKIGERNEALEKLIDECVQLKSDDPCEKSFKIYECYWSGRTKQNA